MKIKKMFSNKLAGILLILMMVLIVSTYSGVQGADESQTAPLNPDFVNYINNINNPKIQQATAPEHLYGAIPPPVDLSHVKSWRTESQRAQANYPATFDLRNTGKVTPVKNQSTSGSCWAFATYGSLESNLLPAETKDFSENNLKNAHGFDWDPNTGGGNFEMSTAYLARWSGPVSETDDPFNPGSISSPAGKPVQKHVQEVHFLADGDRDMIKDYLMNHGAVATDMYMDDSLYYQSTTHSYYCSLIRTINHSVTIVGWDDNYSRYNFKTTPAGNGAFIVKNSWGTGWGAQGYFYISYNDANFPRYSVSFINAEPATNYQRVYQYDPLGVVGARGYTGSTAGWMANVFTAVASEPLTAASWYTMDSNVSYTMHIYINVAGTPTSGTLAATQTGTIAAPGYHTIPLDTPVQLTAGQKFAVVVKLIDPSYSYPLAFEYADSGYSSKASAHPGESYRSSNGTAWTDLTNDDSTANFCLKAFTAATLLITRQPVSQRVNDGSPASFSVTAVGTPPISYQWAFNGSDIPGATSSTLTINNVHQENAGSYTVKITDKYGSVVSDPAILTDYFPPKIIQQPVSQTVEVGATAILSITATGLQPLSYQWKLNNADLPGATAAALEIPNVQPANAGSYKVVVTNNQGSVTSTTAVLKVQQRVLTPTFDQDGGTGLIYTGARNVKISCATPGAVIHYTTNGKDPGSKDPVVGATGLVSVAKSMTLKASAWKSGWLTSQVKSAVYTVTGTVATPTFSLKPGLYNTPQAVVISCATKGATIRYTTDGSEPTPANGEVYTTFPVSIENPSTTKAQTTTIKAKAWLEGWDLSATATSVYTITGTVATPVITPNQENYPDEQTIHITSTTPEATIRYTVNGTTPTAKSPIVTEAGIGLNRNMNIIAKAFKTDWAASSAAYANYKFTGVATPIFSVAEGTYPLAQKVTISCPTANAKIRYTTDDSIDLKTQNTGIAYKPGTAISIKSTATLRAIAWVGTTRSSDIKTATYTITGTVPTPAISAAAKTFTGTEDVTISCTQKPEASIYYTTDGSIPTSNSDDSHSHEYTGTITIDSTTTIKAKAFLTGWTPSAAATATYTATVAKPEIELYSELEYLQDQTIHIKCATEGATIRYTVNGITPTAKSPIVTDAGIVLNRSLTLKAIAYKTGWLNSPLASASYKFTGVATPIFSVTGNTYTTAQKVTISCPTVNAKIRYTTDNNIDLKTPNTGIAYIPGTAIAIKSTATLRAIAWVGDTKSSDIKTATYTITGTVPTPVISADFKTFNGTEDVTISCGDADATIYYTTDGYTPTNTGDPHSHEYTGPITIDAPTTIKAKAFLTDWTPSAVATAAYTATVADPEISPGSETYSTEQTIHVTCATEGATIRYTVNGAPPTAKSPVMPAAGILLNRNLTLRVIASKTGWANSSIITAGYNFSGVAAPVFSVAEGSYVSTQKITVSSPAAGAVIRYTTDNSINLESQGAGVLYKPGTVIIINSTVTLRAITRVGAKTSAVKAATYTITGTVAKPVINPGSGAYPDSQNITISCASPGAAIHYTTNGKEPVATDPVVGSGESLPVANSLTLKAKAFQENWAPSATAAAVYTIQQVAVPVFSPLDPENKVTVSCATPGAIIRYTVNGNDPTLSDPVYNGLPIPMSLDITVKARAWKTGLIPSVVALVKMKYDLTITADGNGSTDPSDVVTVNNGGSTTITAIPNEGFHFLNWTKTAGAGKVVFADASSAGTTVTIINGDATIRANFIAYHTLSVTSNGNGNTNPTGDVLINNGASTTITASSNTGFHFVNWTKTAGTGTVIFGDADSADTTVTLTGGDAIVQANFIAYHTLSVANDGNGNTNPAGDIEVDNGAIAAITATPSTGYHFVNWTKTAGAGTVVFGDADSADTTVTVTDGDATIQANFIAYHTLSITGDGNGNTDPAGDVVINNGASIAITALPNTGFNFINWTKTAGAGTVVFDNADSANAIVTVTGGDATIRANFIAYHTLSINNDGNGNTDPAGEITLNDGASTTITATPNTGYLFVNWTKTAGVGTVVFDDADSANTTVAVTGGNAVIRANFAADPSAQYNLTINNDGNGSATPSCQVANGVSINITATPNTGYKFVNWTKTAGAGAVVFGNAASAETTVTVTGGDATIQANFAVDQTIQYYLTITISGNGIAPSSCMVYNGVSKNISAIPHFGDNFLNWTKTAGPGTVVFGNATSAQTTVTVTGGDATIRANFTALN